MAFIGSRRRRRWVRVQQHQRERAEPRPPSQDLAPGKAGKRDVLLGGNIRNSRASQPNPVLRRRIVGTPSLHRGFPRLSGFARRYRYGMDRDRTSEVYRILLPSNPQLNTLISACPLPLCRERTCSGPHNVSLFGGRGLRARGARLRGEGKVVQAANLFCAGVRVELFLLAIYCAKLRPDPRSQFGSRSRTGLGRRAPWIMREYGLTTAIAMRPLTQPRTCEMSPLIFAAMSWLKFVSTTRASSPSMPSTERTNGDFFSGCSWQSLPCLSFFSFSQSSQELVHWFLPVGVCVQVSKSDVGDGVSLALP